MLTSAGMASLYSVHACVRMCSYLLSLLQFVLEETSLHIRQTLTYLVVRLYHHLHEGEGGEGGINNSGHRQAHYYNYYSLNSFT